MVNGGVDEVLGAVVDGMLDEKLNERQNRIKVRKQSRGVSIEF